jgi:hypothetical protein
VKRSNAARSPGEAATDDLINDAQLIERAVTAIFLSQLSKQFSTQFNYGLSVYFVWFISHFLLSLPRISR